MRRQHTALVLWLLLAPVKLAAQVPPTASSADQLFQAGKFAEAKEQYAQIAADQPSDYHAIFSLGRIALLSNKLDDAAKWLTGATTLKPDETDPRVMLAEVYYQRDDFQQAVAALDGIDVSNNQLIISQYPGLNVALLQSFAGQTPYELDGSGGKTIVKFLQTDPLPLVSVQINGGPDVTFFIDTGGSVVTLDADFAKELGVPQLGTVGGTFAGGQTAEVGLGRIDSIKLGQWTVNNVPVGILPLRQIDLGGGYRIDGIIGTTLLYHFLATMDYPNGQLVLRRKSMLSQRRFAEASSGSVAVPFWIAGDHFMVGWGQVEDLPPSLLFVDSGLVGAGTKLAESVIKAAGIVLEQDKAETGAGGGGTLTIVPYVVKRVSLGNVQEENVQGVFDGPFPWENSFGFFLAGMVGHEFLRPYAVTFNFEKMEILLK
jgi:Aspartyl protease/Tetratricopeptide repeat